MRLTNEMRTYWLRGMFFIFAFVIPAVLSYTANQAEKRNEP